MYIYISYNIIYIYTYMLVSWDHPPISRVENKNHHTETSNQKSVDAIKRNMWGYIYINIYVYIYIYHIYISYISVRILTLL